jgi:fibro-slime domain-containing protein
MNKLLNRTLCIAALLVAAGAAEARNPLAARASTAARPAADTQPARAPISGQGDRTDLPTTDSEAPATMEITAIIRDFRASISEGGHPDFERWTGTTRVGLLQPELDLNAKPVLASTSGRQIDSEYRDRDGRNINPALFDPSRGDVAGALVTSSDDRITSAQTFAQWYSDVPGTNASKSITLTLARDSETGSYVYDSDINADAVRWGGFFPINGELYGDFASTGKNFHFTTEIECRFVHKAGRNDIFTFTGDDDVWVFIDGRLVIDLGGVHSRKSQSIAIDRLGIPDGKLCTLKIFHAERRTSGSNFRMETSLQLQKVSAPQVTSLFD